MLTLMMKYFGLIVKLFLPTLTARFVGLQCLQQICNHTSTKQWHFLESGNNPADDASHGLDSKMENQIKSDLMVHYFCWVRNSNACKNWKSAKYL